MLRRIIYSISAGLLGVAIAGLLAGPAAAGGTDTGWGTAPSHPLPLSDAR